MTREYHGATKTPEHRAWSDMRQRCLNPKNRRYASYGGRGITICPSWSRFSQFLADMGPRPAGKSLDREDNGGPYSRKNCRWATPRQQINNQRNRKDNKTGVRGVFYDATRDLYAVHGIVNGKQTTLGSSRSFEKAVAIRRAHELKLKRELA